MESENSDHEQNKSQEFKDQPSQENQQDIDIIASNLVADQPDLFLEYEQQLQQQQISREQEFLMQLKEKINLIEKYESLEITIKKKRQELENSLNFSILKQQYLINPQDLAQQSVSNKNVGSNSNAAEAENLRRSNVKKKSLKLAAEFENQGSLNKQQKQQFAQYYLKMSQSPKEQMKQQQQQQLSEEYTFHPQLSRKSVKIYESQQKQQQESQQQQEAHHEKLYRKSQSKQIQQQQNKTEMLKQIKSERNVTKMNKNSQKIIFKKIEQLLYSVITEHEDPIKGYITQIKLGTLFAKLGVFKCFIDNDLNKTSLNMSTRYKTNAERADEEKIFLNEFWKILRLSVENQVYNEENNELIKIALILYFLIIFFDNNINQQKACLYLKEKLEYIRNFSQIEEQETLEEDKQDYHSFDFLLTDENADGKVENMSNEFWSLNKLLREFKKIFKDKTQFMEIYKNRKNLLNLQQPDFQKMQSDEYKFAPNICEKSRLLDAQISDNYISRIIQQSGQNFDEIRDNFNKNRYDMLYEHAKFFKEKKEQMIEQKNQQVMSQHSFKPYRETVKKSQYEEYDQNEQQQSQINTQVHEKLYKDGLARKKNVEQKNKDKQREKEVEESLKCTFQPQMATKNSNLQKTLLEYSLNDVKGAFDAIERQYKGRDFKTEKEQAYKNLGALKSQIQADKVESNQKSKNIAKYKQENNNNQEEDNTDQNVSEDQQEIHVDVNIAPGKVGKIIIKLGQNDPKQLAQEFSAQHSLKPEMIPTLENYLKQVIKQHTKKDQGESGDDNNEGNQAEDNQDQVQDNDELYEENNNNNENQFEDNEEEGQEEEDEQHELQQQ